MLENWLLWINNHATIGAVIGIGLFSGLIFSLASKIRNFYVRRTCYLLAMLSLVICLLGQDLWGFTWFGYGNTADPIGIFVLLYWLILLVISVLLIIFVLYNENLHIFESYTNDDELIAWVGILIVSIGLLAPIYSVRNNPKYCDYWERIGVYTGKDLAEIKIRKAIDAKDQKGKLSYLQQAVSNNPAYEEQLVIFQLVYQKQEKKAAELINQSQNLTAEQKLNLQVMLQILNNEFDQGMSRLIENPAVWPKQSQFLPLAFYYYIEHQNYEQAWQVWQKIKATNVPTNYPALKNDLIVLAVSNTDPADPYLQKYWELVYIAEFQKKAEDIVKETNKFLSEYQGDPRNLQNELSQKLNEQLEPILNFQPASLDKKDLQARLVQNWSLSLMIEPLAKEPQYGPTTQWKLLGVWACAVLLGVGLFFKLSSFFAWLGNLWQALMAWWQKQKQDSKKKLQQAVEDVQEAIDDWLHDPDELLLEKAKKFFEDLMSQIPEEETSRVYFQEIINTATAVYNNLPRLLGLRKFLNCKLEELAPLEQEEESAIPEVRQIQIESKENLLNFRKKREECEKYIEVSMAELRHLAVNINSIVLLFKENEVEKAKTAIENLIKELQKTVATINTTIQELEAA